MDGVDRLEQRGDTSADVGIGVRLEGRDEPLRLVEKVTLCAHRIVPPAGTSPPSGAHGSRSTAPTSVARVTTSSHTASKIRATLSLNASPNSWMAGSTSTTTTS